MAETLQLIDGLGLFNARGLDAFVKAVRLASCGLSYAVVSIMGPQSSGKSTLLNHLFNTRFTEMDALVGRTQTTQGVWLAQAAGIDPCTLIMDLEGTDGTERGEDDTAFEKQSSLFALAVSDIVLINMWCHDIGREHAANKPLLKTVFQVMMRLFTPRKTTLLFVIRDKTLTPLEILENSVRNEVLKIWDSVPKPDAHRETPLTEFFNVEVTALSNYFFQKEQFKEDVLQLRQRFFNSIAPGGLAGDRRGVVPGTGFSVSSEAIWKVVKDNKDLDLPTHKVMVATVRCEEIAKEKLSKLTADKEWLDLDESARRGAVPGFGKKVTQLVDSQITSYDAEAAYFEDSVRRSKRDFLVSSFIDIIQPAQGAVVGHHRNKAINKFKQELAAIASHGVNTFAENVRQLMGTVLAEFDEGCADASLSQAGWEKIRAQFQSSKIRDELRRDLETHAASVQAEKLAEIVSQFEERLNEAIVGSAASLLEAGSPDTWPSIRKLLSHETKLATKDFTATLAGFELDKEEEAKLLSKLRTFGRNALKKKAKEEAGNALSRMKDRFHTVFSQDADAIIRTWTGDEDVRAITKDARSAALKLLSVLAAIRLGDTVDGIETALLGLLGDNQEASTSGSKTSTESAVSSVLAASTWDGVPAEDTLITPAHCKDIWRQFKTETQYAISQAVLAQEASRRGNSSLPPMWAIIAMVVLGFNEFMALLRNPLYLAVMFVLYLLGKAVWVQLDIAAEFQAGFLPGIISVTSKLLPTMMKLLKRLADEGQQIADGADTNRPNTTTRTNATVPMQDFSSSGSSGGPTSNGVDTDSLRHRGIGVTGLAYS